MYSQKRITSAPDRSDEGELEDLESYAIAVRERIED